ncbi:MAG: HK97 family phage prohead protease [Chloroflexota bacterium]
MAARTPARSPAPEVERKIAPMYDVKVDTDRGIVEAIVSVFGNVDNGGEVVEPGFFEGSLAERMPKGVWMHDWKTPVAKTLEAKELLPGDPLLPDSLNANGGAYIKAQFNLDTQRGREAFSDIKFGLVDEYSIGYKVLEDRWDTKSVPGQSIRRLVKGKWYEWSPVLVGMNDRTTTVAVKADGEPEPLVLSDEVVFFTDDPGEEAVKDRKVGDGQIAGGDWVAFDQRGRELRGRVTEVSVQGVLAGTSVTGSDEDPALRIQVYVPSGTGGGWQATNRYVGKLVSEVTRLTVRPPGTIGDPIEQPAVSQPLPRTTNAPGGDPMDAQFIRKQDGDGDLENSRNELSFEQITERVARAINRSAMSLGGGYVYVIATYPESVIVRRFESEGSDHRYFRVGYTLTDASVTLGEAEEVRQTYAPVKSDRSSLGIITKLIAEANDQAGEVEAKLKEGRTVSGETYNCLARAHAGIKQADQEIGRLMAMGDATRPGRPVDRNGAAKSPPTGEAARRLRALALEIELRAAGVSEAELAPAH